MALRPGGAKAKGANGEREAADLLAKWASDIGLELNPKRNLEQTRTGGHDLIKIPGLAVEVKRVENLNVPAWWRQAVKQAETAGAIPVLMYRQNRRPWRFKIRVQVVVKNVAVPADVEMDLAAAESWFKYHLWYSKEEIE